MKSVMLSIKPNWCELIAIGKKTIEVRKTRPKLETPFKCYIYCTKDSKDPDRLWVLNEQCRQKYDGLTTVCANLAKSESHHEGNGKVIGEFVCDDIKAYCTDDFVGAVDSDGTIITESKDGEYAYWIPEQKETCLSYNEICAYGNGKTLYGWHIFDLVIYDEPRELSEFKKAGFFTEAEWLAALYPNTHCHYEAWAKKFEITRPPQSWCYVEEKLK